MEVRQRAEQIVTDYRKEIIAGNRPDLVSMVVAAIEDFKIYQQERLTNCPDHPRYKGKRKPVNGCDGCWRIYLNG